ncbi:hypothetical protein GCM10012285_56280 [Streptomyces kronopolitis]|uniref:Transposase n=1 Tax=Streptomyces kronopolitis TaxID=1612435 RepID=A0ABQ2JYX4_9ACTN|nr:hypothetical protein GCM10012285_56280 [Streptomyces kronopolitis]
MGSTARAPARETTILRQLIAEEVRFGEWERGTWCAQPWRAGTSLLDRWARHRQARKPSAPGPDEAYSYAVAPAARKTPTPWTSGEPSWPRRTEESTYRAGRASSSRR